MKIAIFSDIHGNKQALESILKDIKNKNIDEVYCLGDVIAIGPSSKECLDLIIENNIKMVLGNHELYYLKGTIIDDEMSDNEIQHQNWVKLQLNDNHKLFLDSCPMKMETKANDYIIAYQHFLFNPDISDIYPFDDLNIVKNRSIEDKVKKLDADITFIGHEHNSFKVIFDDKKLFDIGSSGCTKDEFTFYTLLSINKDSINIEKVKLKYDRKSFEHTFKSVDYPDKKNKGKIYFGINY